MSSPIKKKTSPSHKSGAKAPSKKKAPTVKKRKEIITLPDDCEKLSTSVCESFKTKDPTTGARKCKIKYGMLGFGNKCVKNEDYDLEKFIFQAGFEDFSTIGEENMEEELRRRNKVCENLSASDGGLCQSALGKKIGCKVNKKLLSPNSCRLDPNLIRFMKKRELLCEKEDCAELRKKGIQCDKCTQELEEMLLEFDSLYDVLVKRKNPPPADISRFFDLADQLKNEWYPYFVTGQKKLLDTLERKRMKIEELHGGARCQAINISRCSGKGDQDRQCKCRGLRDRTGLLCNTHRKCYLQRVEKFNEIRDKFEELCEEKKLCKSLIKNITQLYEMIKYTNQGEISRKKTEVSDMIDYMESFLANTI